MTWREGGGEGRGGERGYEKRGVVITMTDLGGCMEESNTTLQKSKYF